MVHHSGLGCWRDNQQVLIQHQKVLQGAVRQGQQHKDGQKHVHALDKPDPHTLQALEFTFLAATALWWTCSSACSWLLITPSLALTLAA